MHRMVLDVWLMCPTQQLAPPLGAMPRWLWNEQCPTPTRHQRILRWLMIEDAIGRRMHTPWPIPDEWYAEAEQLRREFT